MTALDMSLRDTNADASYVQLEPNDYDFQPCFLAALDGVSCLIPGHIARNGRSEQQKINKVRIMLIYLSFHIYLIFFGFTRIVSSFTKMPFPLYGSGFLHSLIFAANSATTCFSHPSSRILVG